MKDSGPPCSAPWQAFTFPTGGNAMATDLNFSKHSCLAFLCWSLQRSVPKCRVQCSYPRKRGSFGRGTEISGRTPPLWTKLPPMLSQCLGSTRRQEKTHWAGGQRKGNVGRPLSIRECYRAGKLKQRTTVNKRNQATSGVTDVTVNFKLTIISCFMSLQFITISVSSCCSVITNLFFPYLINFNVTEILYSV